MTAFAGWELRGPVRTLHSQIAEWNPEAGDWRPFRNRFAATFRADGQLSEVKHYNPDGSVPREVLAYDDAGRLIEDQWWSDDVLTRRIVHAYDVRGRFSSAMTIDADGTEHEAERCQYDENGRKTKVVVLPVLETGGATCSTGSCGTTYGVEGTDVAYPAPGATARTTIYDEHERPSEVVFHDASHALVSRVVYSRDRDGRVLSERLEFADLGRLLGIDANMPTDERASLMEGFETVFADHTLSLMTYAYDEKGRRIETVRRMGTLSEERLTVRYDDFDSRVDEVRSQVNREGRMEDGVVKTAEGPSHVQCLRFAYQYDAQGNWTERIVLQRMEPNAEERPSNVERRTITYYGS